MNKDRVRARISGSSRFYKVSVREGDSAQCEDQRQ